MGSSGNSVKVYLFSFGSHVCGSSCFVRTKSSVEKSVEVLALVDVRIVARGEHTTNGISLSGLVGLRRLQWMWI
jgi:hypothetical protein